MTQLYIPAPAILPNFRPNIPLELSEYAKLRKINLVIPDNGFIYTTDGRPVAFPGSAITSSPGRAGCAIKAPVATTQYYGLSGNTTNTVWDAPTATVTCFALIRRLGNESGNSQIWGNSDPNNAPYNNWQLSDAGGTGTLSFSIDPGGVVSDLTFAAGFTGNLQLIAGVYTGSQQLLYSDGVLVASKAITGSLSAFNSAGRGTAVGNYYNFTASARSFNGEIYLAGMTPLALSAKEILEISQNVNKLLRPKQRDMYLAVNTGTANALTGTSTESQSATGSPTIGINMVAASVQRQSGTAAVTVSAQLSGTATATQQANGNLQVSIPLNGSTIAQAMASAALVIGDNLAGNTSQAQSGSGVLAVSGSNNLAGTAQQNQSGSGLLNISITLSGTEIQQAYASGTLTNTPAGAVALVGESDQRQAASGVMSIGDNLVGASLAISSATGNLTTLVPLAGATVQAQLASGGLTVTAAGVNLSGQEVQSQLASGTLTLRVNLNAQSVQQALNTGYLTSSGTLVAHPTKWHIKATKRNWTIQATKRTWLIA